MSDWLKVTQEDINRFASVTCDHQWIHTDVERAKNESPFKSTVAHGFLILALLPRMRLHGGYLKAYHPNIRIQENYGLNGVQFLYPVRPEQTIRAKTTLTQVIEYNNCIELVEFISIEIQKNGRQACTVELLQKIFI